MGAAFAADHFMAVSKGKQKAPHHQSLRPQRERYLSDREHSKPLPKEAPQKDSPNFNVATPGLGSCVHGAYDSLCVRIIRYVCYL